jgi:hypothetical protein
MGGKAMTQTNLFVEYVKTRLVSLGHHFALHRDCERLGHQSRNMLQVLIDHRGEMPPRLPDDVRVIVTA